MESSSGSIAIQPTPQLTLAPSPIPMDVDTEAASKESEKSDETSQQEEPTQCVENNECDLENNNETEESQLDSNDDESKDVFKGILKHKHVYGLEKKKVNFDMDIELIPYNSDEYTVEIQIVKELPKKIVSYRELFKKQAQEEKEAKDKVPADDDDTEDEAAEINPFSKLVIKEPPIHHSTNDMVVAHKSLKAATAQNEKNANFPNTCRQDYYQKENETNAKDNNKIIEKVKFSVTPVDEFLEYGINTNKVQEITVNHFEITRDFGNSTDITYTESLTQLTNALLNENDETCEQLKIVNTPDSINIQNGSQTNEHLENQSVEMVNQDITKPSRSTSNEFIDESGHRPEGYIGGQIREIEVDSSLYDSSNDYYYFDDASNDYSNAANDSVDEPSYQYRNTDDVINEDVSSMKYKSEHNSSHHVLPEDDNNEESNELIICNVEMHSISLAIELEESGSIVPNIELEESGSIVQNTELEESGSIVPNTTLEDSGSIVPNIELEESGSIVQNTELEESGSIVTNTTLEESDSVVPNIQLEESGSNIPNTELEESGSIVPNTTLEESGSVVPNIELEESGFIVPNTQSIKPYSDGYTSSSSNCFPESTNSSREELLLKAIDDGDDVQTLITETTQNILLSEASESSIDITRINQTESIQCESEPQSTHPVMQEMIQNGHSIISNEDHGESKIKNSKADICYTNSPVQGKHHVSTLESIKEERTFSMSSESIETLPVISNAQENEPPSTSLNEPETCESSSIEKSNNIRLTPISSQLESNISSQPSTSDTENVKDIKCQSLQLSELQETLTTVDTIEEALHTNNETSIEIKKVNEPTTREIGIQTDLIVINYPKFECNCSKRFLSNGTVQSVETTPQVSNANTSQLSSDELSENNQNLSGEVAPGLDDKSGTDSSEGNYKDFTQSTNLDCSSSLESFEMDDNSIRIDMNNCCPSEEVIVTENHQEP